LKHTSVALTAEHDRASLRCGKPELDRWLIDSALHAATMRTARTFVWLDQNRVVAYYALAGHQILRQATPPRIGRGSPDAISAVLLARLALDQRLQGDHMGGSLLVDACERILIATQQVAARLVVVDAIDGAAAGFYEHFGFMSTGPTSSRLIRKISDIARDLERR